MEVGYASEEFTSAFETRENTAKSNLIHGFQQRLEGHISPEYISNSSSSAGFSTVSNLTVNVRFFFLPQTIWKCSYSIIY